MKAIILAAGQGTRLKKYTENLPKGMLEFDKKTIIERQIDTYRRCGISDIIVVRGFAADKIAYPDVRYYENADYAETNMVESLMAAKQEFDDVVQWDEMWRGKRGDIVQDEGELYRSIHDVTDAGQNRKPSETPSMWTRIGNPLEEFPEWVQPIGAHDAYSKGAKTSHTSPPGVSSKVIPCGISDLARSIRA